MTRCSAAPERVDIYSRITDRIVADLAVGVRPWHKPWNAEHAAGRITRPLRANGVPYQGINVLVLWSTAAAEGYSAPIWITFKQALALGGCVRKGEHGTPVVYASRISKTEVDADTGEAAEHAIPFLKSYTAFNVEQVDGLPPHFYAPAVPPATTPIQRIQAVEQFFQNCKIDIRHGGNQAYYTIAEDRIQMPPIEAFSDAEAYYSTLSHEAAHWTRHPTRLARDFGRKRWGDEGYAMEECVAEITSAYVCADLGISPIAAPREEHAAYLASWLRVLKSDNRAIFTAAAHAQRAATFLNNLQPAAAAAAA
jgi:antirestriction protein ArdC